MLFTWLKEFGELFHEKLKEEGSLVIDFVDPGCQDNQPETFINLKFLFFCQRNWLSFSSRVFWWNTSKMPSPASWVTISRERITDSVNYIFGSQVSSSKANNRNILKPYSDKMKKMIKNQKYNMRDRPVNIGFQRYGQKIMEAQFLKIFFRRKFVK